MAMKNVALLKLYDRFIYLFPVDVKLAFGIIVNFAVPYPYDKRIVILYKLDGGIVDDMDNCEGGISHSPLGANGKCGRNGGHIPREQAPRPSWLRLFWR